MTNTPAEPRLTMRILIAGWFSFANGHPTAGDLMARDVVCSWLQNAGFTFDVASAPPFTGGLDIRTVNPGLYSHLIMVCGPFLRGDLEKNLLTRFWNCRLIGLDLSMPVPLDEWNPFDLLIERDSSDGAHPDFVFAHRKPLVPVVGVCLVEDYPGGETQLAHSAIRKLLEAQPVAIIPIDTRSDTNTTGFRTPAEIEAAIARVDVLITTRLHGLVLALKNGVPALVIDPEPGGAKIRRQALTIDWPIVFDVDDLSDARLIEAFQFCLTDESHGKARDCAERAATAVRQLGNDLIACLSDAEVIDGRRRVRLQAAPEFAGWDEDGVQSPTHTLLCRIEQRSESMLPDYVRRWFRRSQSTTEN